MGLGSEKRHLISAVLLVQDNMFLRELVDVMVRFIADNSLMSFSLRDTEEKNEIKRYFQSIALDKMEQKGYDMGVNTPWGKDLMKMTNLTDYTLNGDDEEDDDYEDEEDEI